MSEMSNPAQRAFFAAPAWRAVVLVALTVAMAVPLVFISFVVEDRVSYRRAALHEVARQWGGEAVVDGPMLVIPVERTSWRKVENEKGILRDEAYTEFSVPLVLRPKALEIAVTTAAPGQTHEG